MYMNRFFNAFGFLFKNLKNIILFEIIYTLFTTAVYTPLLVQLIKVALKLAGISYLTNARVIDFAMKPTTIAILFLVMVMLAIFSLIEIGGIVYCYDLTYHGRRARVTDMIREGMRTAFRLFEGNNMFLVSFMMVIMPITHLVAISGFISTMQVPEFIIEFLKTRQDLISGILFVYAVLAVICIRWISSIQYYTVEKMDFKNARKASLHLNRRKYFGLILSFILWQLLFFAMLVASYVGINYIITKILLLLFKKRRAYNMALIIARILFKLWNQLYVSFIVPVSIAILSGYYYARKKKIKEQFVVPVQEEKRKEAGKLRKTIYVVVVVSAVLNILYVSFDIGIGRNRYNVQLLNRAFIAAHRGYSAEAPENTIPAFEAAIDHYADYVELDVQETRDGVIIVMHDSDFRRVAGINKRVWKVDYEEVKTYDVGSWFSQEFAGTTIPTLEEVMIMAKGKLKLNIEIKLNGHEQHLEESVAELIEKYEMEDECVVTSFQSKALKNIKKYNENIKTGYILAVAYGNFSGVRFADALSINYSFASQALINNLHSSGKEVYVWTVNTPEAINEMIERGADMIITDDPVLARETLTSYETVPYVVKMIKKFVEN